MILNRNIMVIVQVLLTHFMACPLIWLSATSTLQKNSEINDTSKLFQNSVKYVGKTKNFHLVAMCLDDFTHRSRYTKRLKFHCKIFDGNWKTKYTKLLKTFKHFVLIKTSS